MFRAIITAHRHHKNSSRQAPPPSSEPLEGRVLFSTYTVTTLGDSAGSVTPNGTGKFNATTLRAALTAANAHAGADTVNFAAGLAGTINLGKALPAIGDALTVAGPGATKITVQRGTGAATKFSIFHVNAGKTVTISGLKIAKGTADTVGGILGGGGIYNAGTLAVANCTLSGSSSGLYGGGILNEKGATLKLNGSTLSSNTSTAGGGIYNNGTVIGNNDTLTGNSAKTGGGGEGGGVFNNAGATLSLTNVTLSNNPADLGGGVYSSGTITLTHCTLSGNTAIQGSNGGGVYTIGRATLANCTVSGNAAPSSGGGVYNSGTLTVTNSTLSGNSSSAGGGVYNNGNLTLVASTLFGNSGTVGGGLSNSGITAVVADCTFFGNTSIDKGGAIGSGGSAPLAVTNCTVSGNSAANAGGGIFTSGSSALTLNNSIVVGNLVGTPASAPDEISGGVAPSSGSNIIGPAGTGGLSDGVNGNRVGVTLPDLKLGAPASNGGPTRTMALLAGSPAIDAGSNTLASAAGLFADQRGLPRAAGARVDVGAFEVQGTGGSIAGAFFNDKNHDGVRQSTEPPLSDWQVYLDRNNNGVYDPGEQTTFTSSTGAYKFTGLAAGTYRVREVRPDGWTRTRPAGVYPLGYYDATINLAVNGGAVSGKDFGNYLA